MKYKYQSEKFRDAINNLMLPHPNGETEAIELALIECQNGLHGLKRSDIVDEETKELLCKLDSFMSFEGLDDTIGRGLFYVKAKSFNIDEKRELSQVIYDLALWFNGKFWKYF